MKIFRIITILVIGICETVQAGKTSTCTPIKSGILADEYKYTECKSNCRTGDDPNKTNGKQAILCGASSELISDGQQMTIASMEYTNTSDMESLQGNAMLYRGCAYESFMPSVIGDLGLVKNAAKSCVICTASVPSFTSAPGKAFKISCPNLDINFPEMQFTIGIMTRVRHGTGTRLINWVTFRLPYILPKKAYNVTFATEASSLNNVVEWFKSTENTVIGWSLHETSSSGGGALKQWYPMFFLLVAGYFLIA